MTDEMNEHRDPVLAKLFADSEQSLTDTTFLTSLTGQIARTQRHRLRWQIVAFALAIAGIATIVPWLLAPLATVMDLTKDGLSALGEALQTPIAGIIGAALSFAFGPGIYMRWTRRL